MSFVTRNDQQSGQGVHYLRTNQHRSYALKNEDANTQHPSSQLTSELRQEQRYLALAAACDSVAGETLLGQHGEWGEVLIRGIVNATLRSVWGH
jgi:hypothetical protein